LINYLGSFRTISLVTACKRPLDVTHVAKGYVVICVVVIVVSVFAVKVHVSAPRVLAVPMKSRTFSLLFMEEELHEDEPLGTSWVCPRCEKPTEHVVEFGQGSITLLCDRCSVEFTIRDQIDSPSQRLAMEGSHEQGEYFQDL
jgi:hypothetical protein